MTKKQKAEFLLSSKEVRDWVIGHMKCRVQSHGNWVPTDLWEFSPPEYIKDLPNGKELFDWLTNPKQLYNGDWAIALMNALLDRVK